MRLFVLIARSMLGQMLLAGLAVLSAWALLSGQPLGDDPGTIMLSIVMLLVCAAVVAINGWHIRRRARALSPQHDDPGLQPLDKDGLPEEVRPLIEALNRRIATIAGIGERQRFFLSAAAHEMRTPLTIVRTRLELLEDSALKDQLVTDARRLNRLVNDLLTLMSIRGRERVLKPVDLAQCCHRVIEALDSVAAARAVRMTVVVVDEPPPVSGDAGLLQVGITNLVQNAIVHSPLGGTVTIRIDRPARLTVTDQGAGIPDGQTEALFDPFVRLSNDTGGYGLGLTIVRAVADVHGATVRAGNAPRGGAMFVMDFAGD